MADLEASEAAAVDLVRYEPDDLVFDMRAPAAGWILVPDRWSRCWRATVNGRPPRVHVGNVLFRAVAVDAGVNHIEFTFRVLWLPWLLALSWGTLALVLLVAIRALSNGCSADIQVRPDEAGLKACTTSVR